MRSNGVEEEPEEEEEEDQAANVQWGGHILNVEEVAMGVEDKSSAKAKVQPRKRSHSAKTHTTRQRNATKATATTARKVHPGK